MTKIEALKTVIEMQGIIWDFHNGHVPTGTELQRAKCDLSQLQEKLRELPNDEVIE